MDWARAIEINHAALQRIVATLVAVLEALSETVWLPKQTYRSMTRILKPLESAVRRLILITARKMFTVPPTITLSAKSKWPEGLVVQRNNASTRRAAFPLFDPRHESFVEWLEPTQDLPKVMPSIRLLDDDPLVPTFLPTPPPVPEKLISVQTVLRRIETVKHALADMPRQARRLLRTLARNKAAGSGKRLSVLRPGPPPGGRKKPTQEIDDVLKECHALARDAQFPDTS